MVPRDLRAAVGKSELRAPLGSDRKTARPLLPGAVIRLQHRIAQAEHKLRLGTTTADSPRHPLAPEQIALSHYQHRLAFDDELRSDVRHSRGCVDDLLVLRLRDAMAGKLTDAELVSLIGDRVERLRSAGNMTAAVGSDEWRQVARALCVAEHESLARVAERDEGDFGGRPEHPLPANATLPEREPDPVSLAGLWRDHLHSRTTAGFMKDGGRRMAPVTRSLRKFLGHDDAHRVTKKDLLDWRDLLLTTRSAKTVSDMHVSAVRPLFQWACDNERLSGNPAAGVKQPKPGKQRAREAGFTDTEAARILRASRSCQPHADAFGRIRETTESTSAKRWVPLLCAFTGARVGEITQLRREDLRQMGERWVVRVTML